MRQTLLFRDSLSGKGCRSNFGRQRISLEARANTKKPTFYRSWGNSFSPLAVRAIRPTALHSFGVGPAPSLANPCAFYPFRIWESIMSRGVLFPKVCSDTWPPPFQIFTIPPSPFRGLATGRATCWYPAFLPLPSKRFLRHSSRSRLGRAFSPSPKGLGNTRGARSFHCFSDFVKEKGSWGPPLVV